MFVIPIYLCLAAEILLVTANPLLQFLPQSCPICQQNYQNTPSLPVLYQPSNINSYTPTNSVQNPVAPCQNPSNQLNQLILNKIFSNPTLRAVLDPNTKLYGQNGVEIPRQIPSTNNAVPNVINNYIIIPPELLFNGTEDINGKNNARNERIENKCGNKRNSNARRRGNEGTVRRDSNTDPSRKRVSNIEGRNGVQNHTLIDGNTDARPERRKNRRKQVRPRKLEEKCDENGRPKDFIPETQHKVEEAVNTNIQKQVSIPKPPMNDPNHCTLKDETCKREVVPGKSNPQHEHKQDKTRQHPTARNCNRNVEGKTAKPKVSPNNVNPKPRNKEEAVIQDLHRKFPGIPEEVVRDLLAYLKRKMQKDQLGMQNFYYPFTPFPLTYDQLFQNQFVYPRTNDSGSRKRKSKKRRGGNKRKDKKDEQVCETTVELTPTEVNDVPTTTESSLKAAPTDVVSSSSTSTTMATTSAEVQRTSIADIIEVNTPDSAKSIEIQSENISDRGSLGKEDEVPTIFLNDYYPDFTGDSQAYSISNEEYNLRNLVKDRYQYTTDKNIQMNEHYRERRKNQESNKENQVKTLHEERDATIEIETTIARPSKDCSVEESEEIHFIAPPKLEVPDFETRQINSDKQTESDVYYDRDDEEYFRKYIDNTEVHKASTFSDAKTPQYNLKSKPKKVVDIETMFAKSKVAKFGFAKDVTTRDYDNNGELKMNDENPTIVTAKSYPENYWY